MIAKGNIEWEHWHVPLQTRRSNLLAPLTPAIK